MDNKQTPIELLEDIHAVLQRGGQVHAGGLIFKEDRDAIDVIAKAIKESKRKKSSLNLIAEIEVLKAELKRRMDKENDATAFNYLCNKDDSKVVKEYIEKVTGKEVQNG